MRAGRDDSRPRWRRAGDFAGGAGLFATVAAAFAGLLIGAVSAYFAERGTRAEAVSAISDAPTLQAERRRIVERILAGAAPERLSPPAAFSFAEASAPTPSSSIPASSAARPKVVVIIDDMGADPAALRQALAMPGPVTLSFLPYARNVRRLAAEARDAGAEVMLHLPMEPVGEADPGPRALAAGMTGAEFLDALKWNLEQFEGYAGVNNHMGSRLTGDLAAMKTVLGYLQHRDLFFVDSLTTPNSAAGRAAADLGMEIFTRDVFLDPETGDEGSVRTQLALAERIARETGYVVAIAHPRPETLTVLGPWMTTAPARGFDLVYASALQSLYAESEMQAALKAPDLRL